MYASRWPDTFQGEWPGFYVEFRLDMFLRQAGLSRIVEYQKSKQKGQFDYDLVFKKDGQRALRRPQGFRRHEARVTW